MKFTKTDVGQLAFKARSALLSARQRSAFILFDSFKSIDQVLAATVGLGITRDDVDYLVQQGFLAAVHPAVPQSAPKGPHGEPDALLAESVSARSPQERYSAAMPIATKLTASLGLRGFRLNLAVEAASGVEGLLALLPKIKAAVGAKPCAALEQALIG